MGHQDIRATKLIGSEVKSSSGQDLGTINDVILNPSSGRADFAVISLNTSATSGTATSGTSGQLVAVPWTLLRPSPSTSMGGASSPGGTSSGTSTGASSTMGGTSSEQQQVSFTFVGDQSKLQSAPTFSENSWPDISQPSWRHSIYSYFGMTPGTATGGGTTPGGTSGGSSESNPNYPSPSGGSSGSSGSSGSGSNQ